MRRVSASSLGSSAMAASHSSRFALRPGRPREALVFRPSASFASSCSSAALALLIEGFLPFSSGFAAAAFCALAGIARLSGFFGAGLRAAGALALRAAGRAFRFASGRGLRFNALIGLAFFPALRGCFTFDLRFALTMLASSSPRLRRAGKKGAILPQTAPQDLCAFNWCSSLMRVFSSAFNAGSPATRAFSASICRCLSRMRSWICNCRNSWAAPSASR
jgi:hypothetical protein